MEVVQKYCDRIERGYWWHPNLPASLRTADGTVRDRAELRVGITAAMSRGPLSKAGGPRNFTYELIRP